MKKKHYFKRILSTNRDLIILSQLLYTTSSILLQWLMEIIEFTESVFVKDTCEVTFDALRVKCVVNGVLGKHNVDYIIPDVTLPLQL